MQTRFWGLHLNAPESFCSVFIDLAILEKKPACTLVFNLINLPRP